MEGEVAAEGAVCGEAEGGAEGDEEGAENINGGGRDGGGVLPRI